jgi:hypothetical protein
MPRRNRTAWRNDKARADAQHHANVVDLAARRRKRSKGARRIEKRRAA